ncbi:MAG: DNA gyrase inhibitor YacG [Steroidobacteraceae bacterium]
MTRVTCPTCKRLIEYSPDNKWRPFCSERCKLIDLGEWAAEKHAIPVQSSEEDSQEFGAADGDD